MASQLNFNHLHYFHVVAREGSLRAAADRLHVTQPTISEQVRTLESVLGTELFDRRGGRLQLNESGRALLRETETMFSAGERIEQRFLGAPGTEPRELLRVAVSSSVSRSFSAGYLMPLLDDEDVTVRLHVGEHDRVIHSLASWEVDLALTSEPLPPQAEPGIHCERLATRPILAVVGPNADFAEGALEEALAVTPVYAYLAGSQRRMELDTWMVGRGLSPRVYAETNDLPLMIEATSRGKCLAFLPEPAVEGPLERGEIRRLAEVGISAEAYVLYHSQETPARVSGAVRRLRS